MCLNGEMKGGRQSLRISRQNGIDPFLSFYQTVKFWTPLAHLGHLFSGKLVREVIETGNVLYYLFIDHVNEEEVTFRYKLIN